MSQVVGEDRVKQLKVSRWHPVDFLLGTRRGHCIMLVLLFLILIFSGAFCWMATGGLEDMYDASFEESFWFSWGMFFDPGTQMGFPADAETKFKATAVLFSIFGFTYNLLILGLIVEFARIGLETLHKRWNRIVRNGHSLVLGWSPKTLFLLREMSAAARNRGVFNKIVILADEDEMFMWSEIRRHFPKLSDRKHFICRRGCPYECDDLVKASAVSAHDIVVLSSKRRAREADLDAIRSVVALAALTEQPSGNIITEVRVPESAAVVRSIMNAADGVIAREPLNRVLALTALDPVVGDCFISLISFIHGEEFYCKRLDEMSPEVRDCKTFGQVSRALTVGLCVGVNPPDDLTIIAPGDDYVVGAEDRVLVLAHSESELKGGGWGGAGGFLRRAVTSDYNDTNRVKTVVNASPRIGVPKMIIINWSSDMVERLVMMDEYAMKGTQVHILCQLSIKERTARLDSSGVSFDNIVLEHHAGSTTHVRKLAKLPLADAFAVLILADEHWLEGDASESDSACLACVVTITQLCKGQYTQYPGCESNARIICEALEPRTERVLSKGGPLAETATFFHSSALETGIFAMASAEPAVFNTLLILLQRNDLGNITSAPLEEYTKDVGEVDLDDFWTLHDLVRARGEVLLGWHNYSTSETVLNPKKSEPTGLVAGSEVLNPKKSEPTGLVAGSEVIVARKLPRPSSVTF